MITMTRYMALVVLRLQEDRKTTTIHNSLSLESVKSKFSTNNFKKIRIPQFSESEFLIYDRDSQTLYYRLIIM